MKLNTIPFDDEILASLHFLIALSFLESPSNVSLFLW